jgi:DNA-binding transcriptional regulator YiaG
MGKDAQEAELVVRRATAEEPYHFVGSGLGNVYLVGVEYRVDAQTGEQSAVIPSLPSLMEAIGKVLVEKHTALTGDELRFLRKRLRYASKMFAKLVGVSEEQYSRLENGATITPDGATGAPDLCDAGEAAAGGFGGGGEDLVDRFAQRCGVHRRDTG